MRGTKIERQYLGEESWEEIDRETAIEALSRTFYEPEAILAEIENNEKSRSGSGVIQTAFARYRVCAAI